MTDVILLLLHSNTWNHLTVCKQMIYTKWKYLLSKFLRWSLMIFIIKGFRTIVLIFTVISLRNNYKNEDKSPKTLNDKNQASSQKFRQLISSRYGPDTIYE